MAAPTTISRPTWATIGPDEGEGEAMDVDPPVHLDSPERSEVATNPSSLDEGESQDPAQDGMNVEPVIQANAISDEMTDAIGGLMQMASSAASLRPTETPSIPDLDEKDAPVLQAKGKGTRGGKRASVGKKVTKLDSKKPNNKKTPVTSSIPDPETLEIENSDPSADAPTAGTMEDELDEIMEDEPVDNPIPTGGKRKRGSTTTGGSTRGKKKQNPVLANGTDTPQGEGGIDSPAPTPSKRGGKKKKGLTTNGAEGEGVEAGHVQGQGGVTKNQPQYHVMKKEDGVMCTRADIQYDFLEYIFNDQTKAFTAPPIPSHPRPVPEGTKMTFSELYCYTLSGSPRTTKSSKEALLGLEPGILPGKNKAGTAAALASRRRKEAALNGMDLGVKGEGSVAGSVSGVTVADEGSVAGGEDEGEVDNYEGLKEGLSRVCLLINVGRINTTFAFYPLMRTTLRSYHSIPSLQKTNATRRALQDAPRLKIMLKAVLLEGEDSKTLPSTLDQFTEQLEAGKVPSTSICNMLLSFALRPDPAHEKFFSDYPSNINFLTLFTPIPVRSSEKAKAFLYIVHHYLEHPEQRNPFEDEDRPGQMPKLNVLSQEEYEALGENLDTPEEVQFGFEMKAQRIQCKEELALQKQEEERVKADPDAASLVDSSQGTTGKAATMWAKPKKARGPAAHGSGKKRKRHSDPLIAELIEGVEQDLAESEFGEDEIELYPRDRHSYERHPSPPQARSLPLDDEWALGVDTLGLDDLTMQRLILQVNEEADNWYYQSSRYNDPRESYHYVSSEREPLHTSETRGSGVDRSLTHLGNGYSEYHTPDRRTSNERHHPTPPQADMRVSPVAQPPKTHSLSSLLN